jgi:hypothetical protein
MQTQNHAEWTDTKVGFGRSTSLNTVQEDDGVKHQESLDVFTLSIVRNYKQLENSMFRKLYLFPSSEVGWKTPTVLGLLGRANFNH